VKFKGREKKKKIQSISISASSCMKTNISYCFDGFCFFLAANILFGESEQIKLATLWSYRTYCFFERNMIIPRTISPLPPPPRAEAYIKTLIVDVSAAPEAAQEEASELEIKVGIKSF